MEARMRVAHFITALLGLVAAIVCLGCQQMAGGPGEPAVCGNSIVETGEVCDLGPQNSDTQPDACRTNCLPARCGDGVIDSEEGQSDECDLTVRSSNKNPIRVAIGPNKMVYVTDAKAGSVFIYDSNMNLRSELKGLDLPLGLAVAPDGRIYVGNNGRDNVEVFSPEGALLQVVGAGGIQQPADLALDRDGHLYVVDSRSRVVHVYSNAGQPIKEIGGPGEGSGKFKFPITLTISYQHDSDGELYVGDQGLRHRYPPACGVD